MGTTEPVDGLSTGENDEIYLSSIKFLPSNGNTVGSHREPNQK